jgi:hypothetical protein
MNPPPRFHQLLKSSEILAWMAIALEEEPGLGNYELVIVRDTETQVSL